MILLECCVDKKKYFSNKFILDIVLFIICTMTIISSMILDTDGVKTKVPLIGDSYYVNSKCIFKGFTGYDCPVCGMTRAFIYITKLDIKNSLKMNFAALFVYILCLFQMGYRGIAIILKILYSKVAFIIQCILILVSIIAIVLRFISQFIFY